MKKIAFAFLLAGSMLAFAQDKIVGPKEPTVAELKFIIAQKDVEIANLRLQLIQAQATVAYRQEQDNLAKAQAAVQDATAKPAEASKK
jgi:hypothetical protein